MNNLTPEQLDMINRLQPLLNYASFEASKKLFEAGIVLETEFYWVSYSDHRCQSLRDAGKLIPKPYLVNKESITTGMGCKNSNCIPALGFGDVLRELPAGMSLHKIDGHFIGYMLEYTPSCLRSGNVQFKTYNENPIDALIDLLLWVRKVEIK